MNFLRTILFIFLPVFASAQDSAYQAYIKTFAPLAITEQQRTGVPASIKLAQGLLESGAGNGELCVRSNNHFGIKCKNTWIGPKVYHNDDEKGECFRAYTTAEDSYKDHSDFLRNNTRYAPLFSLDVTDYKAWAEGLKKAGYATNPKYIAMLIKVVEENNLNQYTDIALNGSTTAPGNTNESPSQTIPTTTAKSAAQITEAKQVSASMEVVPIIENYPTGYFQINDTKACFAPAGTSVLALANENNISLTEILVFNDMSRVDILEKDQLIFVERKKKRGATAVYEVQNKESLWSISQKQGVRLYLLAHWNNLPSQAVLQKGAKVYLQEGAPDKNATTRK